MPPRMKNVHGKAPSSSNRPAISPDFSTRPIHTGRSVDFKFFNTESFTFARRLEFQGWKHLFQGDCTYYPELVKEFYQNIFFETNESLSTILGTKISLSIESMGKALNIPTDGLIHLDEEDRKVVTTAVLGTEDTVGSERVFARDVSIDNRVLHHFVANAIVPKVGRFDMINEQELYILYNLIEEIPICLPHVMLNEMKKSVRKGNGFLPYGSLITYLLKEAGINMKKEFGKPILGVHVYNSNTLHRMGIYKKDGQWCRRKSVSDQSEEEHPMRNRESTPQSPIAPTSSPPRQSPVIGAQPNLESNAQLVELITTSIMERLESGGWLRAKSTGGSSSSNPTPQISQAVDGLQESLTSINERMVSVSAQIDSITSKQAQMDERIVQIGNDYSTISASLKVVMPTLQVGESVNLYSEMREEASKLRASMMASKQFMENMANAAQGLSQHLHQVCTKLEENVLASLDRLQNLEVLIKRVHTSQTELVHTLAELVDPTRAGSPVHTTSIPEPNPIPEASPIPEPQPSPPVAHSIPEPSSSLPKKRGKRAVRKKAKKSRPSFKYDYGVSDGSPSDENFSDAFS